MENHTQQKQIQKTLTKKIAAQLLLCSAISLFWVIFIWNFWNKGVYALGINAFIFFALFIFLFVWTLHKKQKLAKSDLIWLAPISLIALSFGIYDNPFLKIINILVFPVLFAVFYNQAYLDDKNKRHWNFLFLLKILGRILTFLSEIRQSIIFYIELIIPAGKAKKRIIAKIVAGVVLLLLIALTVFIPLLSSADSVFADKMQVIYDWINEFIPIIFIYKIITFIGLSVLISSLLLAWSKRFDLVKKEDDGKKIDSIVSGIVLGGVLIIYIFFLWVQLERLWVGSLPFDFKETENLVKSGFWQLLFLSIINILIYLFTYRKTNFLVQWILAVFTFASLLLLSSAGYRMGLYVTYYGFSYEKFFASYAVLYCAILFAWLISRLFINRLSNVVKFLIILFFWMYSLVTIFPVEQFILRTNAALSRREDSRIRLFELTMLSPDVLGLIKNYKDEGVLKEKVDYLSREGADKSKEDFNWTPWIERQEKRLADKKWYEYNLMNLIAIL